MKDPFDDPEFRAYFRHAEAEMIPKLRESAMSLMILGKGIDAKLCCEPGGAPRGDAERPEDSMRGYSENEDGDVVLTMSREDYRRLLSLLGRITGEPGGAIGESTATGGELLGNCSGYGGHLDV